MPEYAKNYPWIGIVDVKSRHFDGLARGGAISVADAEPRYGACNWFEVNYEGWLRAPTAIGFPPISRVIFNDEVTCPWFANQSLN